MPDRERVINTIDGCINDNSFCNKCDYDGCVFQHGSCEKDLLAAALSLLKEQEPVKPNGTREAMSFAFNGMLTGYCPRCGTIVNSIGNSGACGKCGQKFDWE